MANANEKTGIRPLHVATVGGERGIVEVLLANGAKVSAKDSDGLTPLHYAAAKGHKRVAELLSQHGGHES